MTKKRAKKIPRPIRTRRRTTYLRPRNRMVCYHTAHRTWRCGAFRPHTHHHHLRPQPSRPQEDEDPELGSSSHPNQSPTRRLFIL